MVTAASGIYKKVSRKREASYGVVPAATGPVAQLLRRVKATFNLGKDTYKSAEIRPDMQVADFRHGVRRVTGQLSGELSPGAYSDEISAVLRRDFVTGVVAAAVSVTIAGAGPTFTITRAAGSYITDGFKVGDVIQLSVGALNAANSLKNVWILGLTATVATVQPLNGVAMVAEGPVTGTTVTVMGKKTYVPVTGHTSISYAVEQFFADIGLSEVYTGIKYNKMTIGLPPTGMATIQLDATGKDIVTAGAQYFTSPSSLTTTAVVAAVNGLLSLGGAVQAVVTGMTINGSSAQSGDPVVGSNVVPNQFPGTVDFSGQITLQFVDATARDLFINETEAALMVALTCDNTAAAQFLAMVMPRIKVGGADKSDDDKALIQTLPFQALLCTTGGAGSVNENTTFVCQDSAAP